MLLEVKNLEVYYGGIHALKDVSISVEENRIVTIIGSNGAGKSSLLNTISGVVKARSGEIFFDGESMHVAPHKIVQAGIVQVPEGRLIFANLTVEDNLKMGAYLRKDKDGIAEDMENVYNMFPILLERKNQSAGTLSGGEQQMLAIGRGLMADPRIILLDEPSLGLAPIIIQQIFDIIQQIKSMGKTILLVEQNAFQALSIADDAFVLEQGKIVNTGKAKDLLNDPSIREAYLGK